MPSLTLHHVGYAAPEIAVAAAAYAARFGYVAVSPVVHDPAQTAYVQFLQLPGDAAYLELVAPDSPASKLTAAVRRGGGLNHLCYLCERMEETIAELEATGMRLISEPKPAVAFAGRRICWLLGQDQVPIELVERRDAGDGCAPGDLAPPGLKPLPFLGALFRGAEAPRFHRRLDSEGADAFAEEL